MKRLFLILFFFSLTPSFSCKKDNTPVESKIIGEWKSEKQVTWYTITAPNSVAVPHWLYTTPPKDTSDSYDEKLLFKDSGKVYAERSDSYLTILSGVSIGRLPGTNPYTDSANYTCINDLVTFYNNISYSNTTLSQSFDIVTLNKNQLVLHKNFIYTAYTAETWFFYQK